MKKILLYSGGMDSWLINKLWNPDICLYVNMHTKYSENEISKLPKNVQVIDFPLGQWERDDAIIPLRNLYLIMVACNMTEDEDVKICLGATAGDRVLDKSEEFVTKANIQLNYLYQPQHWIPKGKKVEICIDYKGYTKKKLIQQFVAEGGNLEEAFSQSFSCYNPVDGKECWQCKPCFRKFIAFALNGKTFDSNTSRQVIRYIKTYIKPQIDRGNYGRKEEESDIKEVLDKWDIWDIMMNRKDIIQ